MRQLLDAKVDLAKEQVKEYANKEMEKVSNPSPSIPIENILRLLPVLSENIRFFFLADAIQVIRSNTRLSNLNFKNSNLHELSWSLQKYLATKTKMKQLTTVGTTLADGDQEEVGEHTEEHHGEQQPAEEDGEVLAGECLLLAARMWQGLLRKSLTGSFTVRTNTRALLAIDALEALECARGERTDDGYVREVRRGGQLRPIVRLVHGNQLIQVRIRTTFHRNVIDLNGREAFAQIAGAHELQPFGR